MIPRLLRQSDKAEFSQHIDMLICGCGYETRSVLVAQKFETKDVGLKLAYCFVDPENDERILQHRKYFTENGFKVINMKGDDADGFRNSFLGYFNPFIRGHEVITIDISSMTRIWYATFMSVFSSYDIPLTHLTCVYYYSQREQVVDRDIVGMKLTPMQEYSNISVPDKPTALVVGVGEYSDVANYLTEYFNAEHVYCFYPGESLNPAIRQSGPAGIVEWRRYTFHNMIKTFSDLRDICASLIHDYRVVIIPCGPKLFTMIALLLKNIMKEVDIWKAEMSQRCYADVAPNGNIIQVEIEYDK